MKFPAVNVSITNWDKNEDYLIYILEDEFIYTSDNQLYKEYFLDKLFVDSNGDVYQIIDRKLPGLFLQILSFIPNFCKVELIFKPTHIKMTIDEVRLHLLNQTNKLDDDENKFEWIEKLKKAKTFEEIIFG
jgi:hypothetical protein